mgnify:CR=1 FL=1
MIVTELMDGSLRDLIKNTYISSYMAIEYMFQIVEISFDSLYMKKVMHRDIKPENILFTRLQNGDKKFKLADFGIAKAALSLIHI